MRSNRNYGGLWGVLILGVLTCFESCHPGNQGSGNQRKEKAVSMAQDYYRYFQGTLGAKSVVVHLIKTRGRFEGTFLDSTGQPLALSGGLDSSQQLVLVSYSHYNPVDTFTGQFPQPGVYQGTCRDTAGNTVPFTLQEVYPTGTIHWNVYSLSDSTAFDTASHSPKARLQYMLLWPDRKALDEQQLALVTDSIVKEYFHIDTMLEDPRKVLESAADTFLTGYEKFSKHIRGTDNPGMGATLNWESDIDMKVLWNADHIISLSCQSYEYTGGAHGLSNTALLVFDLKQNRTLTMEDIFRPGYERVLQRALENELRNQYDIPASDPLNGNQGILFDKHLALTKNFYLTGQGIGFIYNPYEVAPYAVGQIELYIPFRDIRNILKPRS